MTDKFPSPLNISTAFLYGLEGLVLLLLLQFVLVTSRGRERLKATWTDVTKCWFMFQSDWTHCWLIFDLKVCKRNTFPNKCHFLFGGGGDCRFFIQTVQHSTTLIKYIQYMLLYACTPHTCVRGYIALFNQLFLFFIARVPLILRTKHMINLLNMTRYSLKASQVFSVMLLNQREVIMYL